MSAGKTVGAFLIGVTAGATVALLFAPKSGERLRGEIAQMGDEGARQVRRRVRRSIEHLQDLVEKGSDRVTVALNTSKTALDSLADRLD